MAVFPTAAEQLEEFISRVTLDETSQLVESFGVTVKEEVPRVVEDYLGARLEMNQAALETAKQEANDHAEAVKMTSAQALGEAVKDQ